LLSNDTKWLATNVILYDLASTEIAQNTAD
jgi:hypothetical protein